ncbi:hypothetical protein CQ020_21560 [Arthrobacter sp. MYb23]|uniref:hypothetical protein n=1 Tax=unclassified Arthrobacter TaxID=235627 RepID=UPI000CFDCBCD|nr:MULTISPECIES: hypothetical protein [unclassified Arthrobacter]PRB37037.1 hypothetical protein CQ038_20980 [Arthrobacter sp. MYb51]PRB90209.1 hypothetical protein CQ020_21560 [Arthrobacter sp. MYb23]
MISEAGGPAPENKAGNRAGNTAGHRTGHTRIARTALRRTVETITARAFQVGGSNVTAELDDDSGRLGVKVSVQLALPPLLGPRPEAGTALDGTATHGTVFEKAQAARTELVARSLELTGMELGRVDIRLTGSKQAQLRESHSTERRVQ